MNKACLFLCLLFFLFNVLETRAQNTQGKLDSLLANHKNYNKEDSIKLKNLKEIYRQYMRMKNLPKVEEFVNRTAALAVKLNLKKFEAEAYYRQGLFYHGQSNYEKAEDNYLKSIKVYTQLNDLDWVAGIYLNLGALYISIPDYAKALEVNQKAISVFQKNGNEVDLASCYANISSIYVELDQQDNALFYLQKALKIFEKEGENSRGVAVVCNSIGDAYFTASNDELIKMGIKPDQKNKIAMSYFERALKAAIAISDNGVQATSNIYLGKVYEAMGERQLALKAYQISVDKNSDTDQKDEYAASLLALANFYEQDKDYIKSFHFLLGVLKIGQENIYQLFFMNLDIFFVTCSKVFQSCFEKIQY